MNDYVNYMDSLEPSDELISRLKSLKSPRRRIPIYRAASLAAALILAVGVGAVVWTLSAPGETRHNELGEPDIIIDPSQDDVYSHITPYGGGYDIVENGVVTHYTYPRLDFARGVPGAAADNYFLGVPDGSSRPLTDADLTALLCERFLEHLDFPDDTEVSGTLYFTAEHTPCGAEILLRAVDRSIYIEERAGLPVPSCVATEGGGHTMYKGTDILTLTDLYGDASCEVSFLHSGTGWKATVQGENYMELASRFVRLALDELRGLDDVRYEYTTPLPAEPADPDVTITHGYDPTK